MRAGLASLRTDNDYQRAAQRVGSTYLTGYFPLDAGMKGRLNGAPTPVVTGAKPGGTGDGDGPHGRGAGTRFAAVGDRVTLGTTLNFGNTNHTYVAWIRPNTSATYQTIMSSLVSGVSKGELWRVNSDGSILFEVNSTAPDYYDFSSSTTPKVLFNRWNCVALAYSAGGWNANYARFSVNGSAWETVGPSAFVSGLTVSTNPLTLGVYSSDNTSGQMYGDIAHLSIYNEDMDIPYVRELIGAMQR